MIDQGQQNANGGIPLRVIGEANSMKIICTWGSVSVLSVVLALCGTDVIVSRK